MKLNRQLMSVELFFDGIAWIRWKGLSDLSEDRKLRDLSTYPHNLSTHMWIKWRGCV